MARGAPVAAAGREPYAAGMRAMVLHSPKPAAGGPLIAEERPAPEPAAGELRLRVSACAVCRTDLQLCEGDLAARRLPVVPGHQVVGVVDALGSDVPGWALGDRAGLTWLAGTDGTCRFCRTGRENLCDAATFTGWDLDGGYAEAVEELARATHERLTLEVLLSARPLADEHQRRPLVAVSEHDLVPPLVEAAALAVADVLDNLQHRIAARLECRQFHGALWGGFQPPRDFCARGGQRG